MLKPFRTLVCFAACLICVIGCRQQATSTSETSSEPDGVQAVDNVDVDGSDDPDVSVSHCFSSDTVLALNDNELPEASSDLSIPRLTWWDHLGSTEWVSYEYSTPREFRSSSVYWFDDTGFGQCRPPMSYRLLWHDGSNFRPVKLKQGENYGLDLDKLNEFSFEPVTTDALKLEVTLQPEFSGGILEWQVH